jgi:hypothetical protein
MVLALGAIWLLVEAVLRYQVTHGVNIVLWHGKWPSEAAGQRAIEGRIQQRQTRELELLKRVRPIPIAIMLLAVVLIIIAAI